METHESPTADGRAGSCPLPGVRARPLSWELGERVVADAGGHRARLARRGGSGAVDVYDATAHTAVVVARSPVGRRRYYEVPAADVDRALTAAANGEAWDVARSP